MLLYVAVVGVFTLFFCLMWMKKHKPLTLPGPKGLPFVRNLLQLANKSPHAHLTEWAKQYGGVYSINLMGDNWVVVSSYEALREVLVKLVHDVGSYNAQVGAALYGLNLLCLIVISGKPCQIAGQLIDII